MLVGSLNHRGRLSRRVCCPVKPVDEVGEAQLLEVRIRQLEAGLLEVKNKQLEVIES